MRTHLLRRLLMLTLLVSLALAPAADAYNNGRGFYGETNDKVVTNAGFILIVFFPLFVFLMSMLQKALERRKEARKAAQKALLGNAQWRGGW
jgi:Zn-dependent protease with chaperone function